eukprot:4541429-Amphidinium_carterae.1
MAQEIGERLTVMPTTFAKRRPAALSTNTRRDTRLLDGCWPLRVQFLKRRPASSDWLQCLIPHRSTSSVHH